MNKPLVLSLLFLAAPAFAADSAGPSDAQIAHIVVTANAVDVDAGKLAEAKTKNNEVKKFAEQMVTDHTAVNEQAAALAKKLGVTPEDNDVSRGLSAGGHENMAKLEKLSGKAFDREYVGHEVAYHQAVLDAIDKTLIPSAHNEELKALITKVRPAIAAHLEHAKMVAAKLSRPAKGHAKGHG
jgi:putative membrane protein